MPNGWLPYRRRQNTAIFSMTNGGCPSDQSGIPARRLKSCSSTHASAAAISTSRGTAASAADASGNRSDTGMPRTRSVLRTSAASSSARPAACPSARACSPSDRSSGVSSGPVPSRAPSVRPIRSSARHVYCGRRRLGQGRVDLRRRPAGEGAARRRGPVPPALQPVDGHARRTPAARPGRRHHDPQLRKSPRFVERQLAGSDVRRMVHLQHDVRQVVLADDERSPRQPRAAGVQVQGLVRLHHPLGGAASVPHEQVDGSERGDRRAPHQGDPLRQVNQPPRRALVDAAGRFRHHPRRLGPGVPVLEAALEVREPVGQQAHRAATGKAGGVVRGPGVPWRRVLGVPRRRVRRPRGSVRRRPDAVRHPPVIGHVGIIARRSARFFLHHSPPAVNAFHARMEGSIEGGSSRPCPCGRCTNGAGSRSRSSRTTSIRRPSSSSPRCRVCRSWSATWPPCPTCTWASGPRSGPSFRPGAR